ncbi:MAG TPA: bifunctional diaminohydroxyphosphoribosylaminopyrimidine deaminase/5-amino-6-(5-phosphoribosylamino)uracil reductase RibD [Longimicrobiales bacterium]
MSDTHARFMRSAVQLAERGWGRVQPNPMVGAVVVRDGTVIAEGWHHEYGGAHAEVDALADAGAQARGATLYVSLEPCSHHGKTPPCTDAIIRAGVATVVFGAHDPNPEARGGADVLRRAGINVVGGVEADAVRQQNAIFFHAIHHHAPYVALKLAMSLDARIARGPGERTRITSDDADAEVHRLRSGYDAVLIGSNTARIDDPLLTVRKAPAPIRPPVRVVLDSEAALSPTSALVTSVNQAPVWVFTGPTADAARIQALEAAGARVFAARRQRAPLKQVLDTLWQEGVQSVFCEGGSRVATALLARDLVQRVYLFIAPILLGGQAVPAFAFEQAPDTSRWRPARIAQIGDDALLMLDREPDRDGPAEAAGEARRQRGRGAS